MGALVQSLKILFLLFTTIFTVYTFLKDYRKGLVVYIVFMCICGLLGFARPIYAEAVVLPISVFVAVVIRHSKISCVSFRWLFLLILAIITTTIAKEDILNTYDELFIFGFVLFAFSRFFFSEDKYTVHILALLWLYAFSRIIWILMTGGSSVLTLSDASDASTRMAEIQTGLESNAVIDPNYFGFVSGMGAVLSFLYFKFYQDINRLISIKFLNKRYIPYIILCIGVIEVFFTVRGLSRGMLLSLVAALGTFLFVQKDFAKFLKVGAVFAVVYLIISRTQIYNLYLQRFVSDDSGSGRYEIWEFIWNFVKEQGPLTFIFGCGLNFPWWDYWRTSAGLAVFSTHNSWMTVFLDLGLWGCTVFFVTILQSVINGLRNLTYINQIKLVLLAYVVVGTTSIEPFHYTWGWIPLVAACSIWKPRTKR